MKKTLKILSIVLLSVAMLFTFAQPISLAANTAGEGGSSASDIIDGLDQNKGIDPGINDLASTIISWIFGISVIVAIIVVMYIGIKFIIGGTQEKAEYKKSLMPVLIGVILVVFATGIVKFLFSMKS